jgi:hypothetical protein
VCQAAQEHDVYEQIQATAMTESFDFWDDPAEDVYEDD